MDYIGSIVFIFIAILLFDFLYFGLLPAHLGIYPRISDFMHEDTLLDDPHIKAKTEIEGKHVKSMINNRKGYISIVVTSENIYFKNTRKTYILNIPVRTVTRFYIEKKFGFKNITLVDIDDKHTKLYPYYFDRWVDVLSKLKINQVSV